jgi:hypothetical protein
MRKALIGILMAATVATPVAAQDGGWHGRGHDGGEQRSQRAEQRSESHQQRQETRQVQQAQPQRQQVEQAQRFERREFRQQQAPAQVQVQQQEQVRGERNWQGRGGQNNAERFAAEREASRRSAEQTIGGSFTRQAAQNERRYEQQTLRREQQGDNRRWDGNRNGRNDGRLDGNRNGRNDGRWDGNRNGRTNWNRGWRNDNRYDWQRYRYQNRRIFSPGRYFAPYGGYGYNPLSIGIVLGEAFFGRNYWIDPLYYHLPPAPPGTEWVRYYDDVVLVDIYTGEVLDVINDFFY